MNTKILAVITACLMFFQLSAQENTELIPVEKNGKWGFVDRENREVIAAKYDDVGTFSEGLVAVALNSKVGFIDQAGIEIIPIMYDKEFTIKGRGMTMMKNIPLSDIQFSKGMVRVFLKGKWGYIDKEGNKVINFKYNLIDDFSESDEVYALAGTKWVIVDRKGNEKSVVYKNGMPVKFTFGVVSCTIVDFFSNRTEEGKTSINFISAETISNIQVGGRNTMEIGCYFISGGEEYRPINVSVGGISEKLLFDTSVEPEIVVFYEKYHPDEKVKIKCK